VKTVLLEPIFIGLTAKMRSGKDTVHELLSKTKRGSFIRLAYGDELKRQYHELNGHGSIGKDRKGYQSFGQSERAKNPNVWVEAVDEKIQDLLNFHGRNIVITDVRQPNEVEQIRMYGGYLIRINVDDEIRLERMNAAGDSFTLEDFQHETESYIDGFSVDYEIDNNRGLTELATQLDTILVNIIAQERNRSYMPNLDRFSQGLEDVQQVKVLTTCDVCGSDIYEGGGRVTSAATENEEYCSVGCLLNAIDMQQDE
jgi:dephospho-CoA kinase